MSQQDMQGPILIETQPGSYAMFLYPDMSAVKVFRRHLRESLQKHNFGPEDILQIELAADEAVTNSITANVACNSEETIICRWIIQDMKITIYVLDYGAGFKPKFSVVNEEPKDKPGSIESFLEQIKSHQATKPDTLPFHGVKVGHKNTGKGLKIIYSLMDSVKIFFHANGVVLDTPGEDISGSIVELEYDVKKRIQ